MNDYGITRESYSLSRGCQRLSESSSIFTGLKRSTMIPIPLNAWDILHSLHSLHSCTYPSFLSKCSCTVLYCTCLVSCLLEHSLVKRVISNIRNTLQVHNNTRDRKYIPRTHLAPSVKCPTSRVQRPVSKVSMNEERGTLKGART